MSEPTGPPPTPPAADLTPVERQARALSEEQDFASAVRVAYRAAFDDTVRAYGLVVPPARTDRQFLREFLRPDMGKLTDRLPRLYELYEPARFGIVRTGDVPSLLTLLRSLYSETVLGRIYDPRFQPQGPTTPVAGKLPTPEATERANSGRGTRWRPP
jgi:hypothetical protein